MTLRNNTARSIILATSALQLAAASLVHANGIQNGGFNPGPGGTVPSWNAHAGAVPFDPQTGTPCDGPAAVAVPVGGGNHRAWLGRRNPVGPGGCTPQAVWQTYNCSPNGEPTPPGTHCVVEFDARFTPGPGGGATSAGVVLRNPAGTNAAPHSVHRRRVESLPTLDSGVRARHDHSLLLDWCPVERIDAAHRQRQLPVLGSAAEQPAAGQSGRDSG